MRCMYHGWRYDGHRPVHRDAGRARRACPILSRSPVIRSTNTPACSSLIWARSRRPRSSCRASRRSRNRPGCASSAIKSGTTTSSKERRTRSTRPTSATCTCGERLAASATRSRPRSPSCRTKRRARASGRRPTARRTTCASAIGRSPTTTTSSVPGPARAIPWADNVTWHVPIDDEHTMRFAVTTAPSTDPETDRRFPHDRVAGYNPADHYRRALRRAPHPRGNRHRAVIATQDYVALRGQGVIVDRSQERLGQSDAGIALLRRIFLRELEAIRNGRRRRLGRGCPKRLTCRSRSRSRLP